MEIKVPFLKNDIGAGDIVKAATGALGIQPCTPCEERRKKMNESLRLIRQDRWGKPPDVPAGWTREATYETETKRLEMFAHTTGKLMIWHIIDGQYRQSHTFCCGERMRGAAADKWAELCRSL